MNGMTGMKGNLGKAKPRVKLSSKQKSQIQKPANTGSYNTTNKEN